MKRRKNLKEVVIRVLLNIVEKMIINFIQSKHIIIDYRYFLSFLKIKKIALIRLII